MLASPSFSNIPLEADAPKAPTSIGPWLETREMIVQLEAELSAHPEEAATLAEIKTFFDNKLWHEFTDVLFSYIERNVDATSERYPATSEISILPPVVQTLLYVVRPNAKNLNPCRILHLLWRVSSKLLHPLDAVRLADAFATPVSAHVEASLRNDLLKVFYLFDCPGLSGMAKHLLGTIGEAISKSDFEINLETYGVYYWTLAKLARLERNASEHYKNIILYASYIRLDSLDDSDRKELALHAALSSLAAADCFGFSELLQSDPPLMNCLEGSDNAWLVEFLRIYRDARTQDFERFYELHKSKMHLIQEMSTEKIDLTRKMNLVAFLDLCFRRPKQTLTFRDLAEHCAIAVEDVEILAMEAMSLRLVTGLIDGINETIDITWMKPQILDNKKLELMKDRLYDWVATAEHLVNHTSQAMPGFSVSV